jgi:lysophospholipase L1-like esterase
VTRGSTNAEPHRERAAVRIAALLVSFAIALGFGEIGARLLERFEQPIRAALGLANAPDDLDAYEMPDPENPGNWVLRPGYTSTLREVVAEKAARGKADAAQRLQTAARTLGIPDDEVVYHNNAHGFRGPELDESRARPRILAIGDSCTAGSQIDRFTYARSLERSLATRGIEMEVVNAGVEGYAPKNVRMRLDRLVELKPQWTTIYLGWNAIYSGRQPLEGPGRWSHFWRIGARTWNSFTRERKDTLTLAREALERPSRPDATVLEAQWLRDYTPEFLADIEAIVDRMQDAGSRVVLVTLPGLFTTRQAPTARALEVGHLPVFTDNPYVLAAMSERTNEALRSFAARRGLPVIDLERWADESLHPRDAFFIDSVHLDELGQEKIGIEMAEAFAELLSR